MSVTLAWIRNILARHRTHWQYFGNTVADTPTYSNKNEIHLGRNTIIEVNYIMLELGITCKQYLLPKKHYYSLSLFREQNYYAYTCTAGKRNHQRENCRCKFVVKYLSVTQWEPGVTSKHYPRRELLEHTCRRGKGRKK